MTLSEKQDARSCVPNLTTFHRKLGQELSTMARHLQIRKYLGGYFLHYLPYFLGDSPELRKGSFGCAQLDDMANFAEIPGTDYLGLTGVGKDIAGNLSFYALG